MRNSAVPIARLPRHLQPLAEKLYSGGSDAMTEQRPSPVPQAVAHETPGASLNKTEAEYLGMLQRDANNVTIMPQAVKLAVGIPGKRCWYTPDFLVVTAEGIIEMHEVKGPYEHDDSRRARLAAQAQFPFFRWVFGQKKGGAWTVVEM